MSKPQEQIPIIAPVLVNGVPAVVPAPASVPSGGLTDANVQALIAKHIG